MYFVCDIDKIAVFTDRFYKYVEADLGLRIGVEPYVIIEFYKRFPVNVFSDGNRDKFFKRKVGVYLNFSADNGVVGKLNRQYKPCV
ncbi:hypothetical protein SDC9_92919 [bioreactor metagenome]|uniref:Uncharacterized protein n=1 Tax=bioreactor metagenome TaxID=1076179 RepID=A0A645A1U2_9ZZZZ